RDTGFAATSSLAGGRLATELRDTPVAYSVINREFIDALGLTDLTQAAEWSPNTVINIGPNGGGLGDDQSKAPGSNEVRGTSGSGRRQRNFFVYNAPMDSYSVERFDFGRGPNAVLFGNGSLGGVSSTMTKQARFDAPFTTLTQRVGSWSNFRTEFDVNRPLGEKLAIRAAAVWSESEGWRYKQFNKIRAAFLTGTVKLGRNTSIRLEGEYGESARNQTFTNITDHFSGWDGVSTFSGALTTLPADANARGISRRGANHLVYDLFSGMNAVMNYQNDPITLAGDANGQVPIAGFVRGSLPAFNTNNANILHSQNVPANRFANALAGSSFRLPSESFSMASDAPVYKERFHDVQLTLDHRIRGIFLQAAVDVNRANQETFATDVRGAGQIRIDINRALPNGAPNPHFLQPYSDANIQRNPRDTDAEAFRLAVGSSQDAGRWGRYTWNVMGGFAETRDEVIGTSQLSTAQNADRRLWGHSGRTDQILIRRYWNESSRPIPGANPVRYIDPISGIDRTITPMWALQISEPRAHQVNTARYKYAIAALNAKFWRDQIVFLGAVRGDDFYSHNRTHLAYGDYSPTTWDGRTPILKPGAPPDYASLTYIPKDASGTPIGPAIGADNRPRANNGDRLPQYANDRFKSDYDSAPIEAREITRSLGALFHVTPWLSPYINYAETFNPASALPRVDSSHLPSTVTRGFDFGVRASWFKNRLNLNLLYYRNEENNSAFGSGIRPDVVNLLSANAVGDTSPAGRNIRGLADIPAFVQDLRDREAEGYELEIVANVVKGWRLTLNVGLPKAYENNSFQDSKKYLDGNAAAFRQVAIDAGAVISADNVATVDASIPLDQRSLDVNTAVNAYNNLVQLRRGFVDNRRLLQDQPNANVYSDYTVQSGKLRGLRLGLGGQYRGKSIIGTRANDTIADPSNPARAIDNPAVDAYTPVYAPNSYYTVTATLGYKWRLGKNRELGFNLRVNNLLDARGPLWARSTALRPANNDYTSPARETVANIFALKTPISFNLSTTLKF
ncbi:MAG: TonB-dependent receptor plug domain-containing protein, partial [Opitutaceae bacterium]